MPGEKIMISTTNYPELQGLAQGDDVTLKVVGKVTNNDGENIEVETIEIESEVDDAAQFQKKMSRQPAMENLDEESEME